VGKLRGNVEQRGFEPQALITDGDRRPESAMRRILHTLDKIADTELSVFIGRVRDGQELIARALHTESFEEGNKGRFVANQLCCHTGNAYRVRTLGVTRLAHSPAQIVISAGCFEEASGGTLFLDELNRARAGVAGEALAGLQERECTRIGDTRPSSGPAHHRRVESWTCCKNLIKRGDDSARISTIASVMMSNLMCSA